MEYPEFKNTTFAYRPLRGERGFILIVTMLILVVLTVLGMAALDSSTFEVQIANNDRWSRAAFNLADGATHSTKNLIIETLAAGGDTTKYGDVSFTGFNSIRDNVAVPHAANDFYRRIFGSMPTQDEAGINPILPDAQIAHMGDSGQEFVEIYILSRDTVAGEGKSIETHQGYKGYGKGLAGGSAQIVFDFNVDGYSFNNSRSALAVRYALELSEIKGE